MLSQIARLSGVACVLLLVACATQKTTDPPARAAPQAGPAAPTDSILVPDAPQSLIVREGDSTWSIAKRFLVEPWYWERLWAEDGQKVEPPQLYVGDRLDLYYDDHGQPRLRHSSSEGQPRSQQVSTVTIQQPVQDRGPVASAQPQRVKLSPRIRSRAVALDPQKIPVRAIAPFLIRPRVVDSTALLCAGYIVASEDGRLIFGNGDKVYVRNLCPRIKTSRYSVFRQGKVFKDPESGEALGYEAVHVADAKVIRRGKPVTVELFNPTREATTGDRLLPQQTESDFAFMPRAPDKAVKGEVLSLFDRVGESGGKDVIAINLGEKDSLRPGDVLSVSQVGRRIKDRFSNKEDEDAVKLPNELSGLAMVFRVFDRISYVLVMESVRPIRIGDVVGLPRRGSFQNEALGL